MIRENISDILENNNLIEEKIIEESNSSAKRVMEDLKKITNNKSNFSKKSFDSRNTIVKKLENLSNIAYSFITKSIYYSDNYINQIDYTNSEQPLEISSFLGNNFSEENKDLTNNLEFNFSHSYDKNEIKSNIVLFSIASNCSKCNKDLYCNDSDGNNEDYKRNDTIKHISDIVLCEDCQMHVD